jgi:hypothetical protein
MNLLASLVYEPIRAEAVLSGLPNTSGGCHVCTSASLLTAFRAVINCDTSTFKITEWGVLPIEKSLRCAGKATIVGNRRSHSSASFSTRMSHFLLVAAVSQLRACIWDSFRKPIRTRGWVFYQDTGQPHPEDFWMCQAGNASFRRLPWNCMLDIRTESYNFWNVPR